MSFMNENIDLSGTLFESINLKEMKSLLNHLLNEISPEWSVDRQGCFSDIMSDEDNTSPLKAIWIIHLISEMRNNVISQHKNRYESKVRDLIKSRNIKQFRDLWNEFEACQQIISRTRSIHIEPLVGDDAFGGPVAPSSPDFSTVFENTTIYFEVTTLDVEDVESYSRTFKHIVDTLSRLVPPDLNKSIDVIIPFKIKLQDVSVQRLRMLAKEINFRTEGRRVLSFENSELEFSWRGIQSYKTIEDFIASGASYGAYGMEIIAGRYITANMKLKDEDEFYKRIKSSLINKIKGKRRQMIRGQINVISIYLAEGGLNSDESFSAIAHAIEEIFQNLDYNWLNCIVIAVPIKNFLKGDTPSSFIIFNRNSEIEGESMLRRFFG